MKRVFSFIMLSGFVATTACKKSDNGPALPNKPTDTTSVNGDIRGVITSDQHWTQNLSAKRLCICNKRSYHYY